MGELARVRDMQIHEIGTDLDEAEILRLYSKGRDLVWETRSLPDFDRLDAVEGRLFEYLRTHSISFEHPDYIRTMVHWKELAAQSGLVRDRMKARLKMNLVPDKFKNWFDQNDNSAKNA